MLSLSSWVQFTFKFQPTINSYLWNSLLHVDFVDWLKLYILIIYYKFIYMCIYVCVCTNYFCRWQGDEENRSRDRDKRCIKWKCIGESYMWILTDGQMNINRQVWSYILLILYLVKIFISWCRAEYYFQIWTTNIYWIEIELF